MRARSRGSHSAKITFNQNYWCGLHQFDLAAAAMRDETVAGPFHCQSVEQLLQVTKQEIVICCGRVIVVERPSLVFTQSTSIQVIRILVQDCNTGISAFPTQDVGHKSLSRPRSPADSDHEWGQHESYSALLTRISRRINPKKLMQCPHKP